MRLVLWPLIIQLLILLLTSCTQPSGYLIGNWQSTDRNSKLIFKEDGTFDHYLRINDIEIRHTKGKYMLTDDGGVFLRLFGSMHWPSDSNTTDYKLNIAHYFIIDGNNLVDDQEDYKDIYMRLNSDE
jgi:hypothetical protein